MIDPKKWFALMCAAQRRNEGPIWGKYSHLGSKRELYASVGEKLEFAHNAAVESADIVAEEAYVKVFHVTYETAQREAYDRMAPPPLAAHYEPKDRPPNLTRIKSAGIDPNMWYALMCNAQNRNEELFWRALKPFGNKDLNLVDELLEKSRVEAVEAASLAAERAYIRAFNDAYDDQYQITWEECGMLSLASEIIHAVSREKSS